MYLKIDLLGHREIMEGKAPSDAELASSESAQLYSLHDKFLAAYNESFQYKKPFKNPLTNRDMAWLYEQAAQVLYHSPMMEQFSDPGDIVFSPVTVLKEIDLSLERLRKAKIPIIGEKAK